MHSIPAYLLTAVAGLLIAHFFSRAPELRSLRLVQLIFVPAAFVVCLYFLPEGKASPAAALSSFVCFLAVLLFLVVLLARNIAYYLGAGVAGLLDPHDWTPAEEEIALRPIRHLIDQDEYTEALSDLDELLKKHKPTYEALLLKAKLLYHFGSVDETVTTLMGLMPLSNTTDQQMAVMEMFAVLEDQHRTPPKPLARGSRRVQIGHELILFPVSEIDYASHKLIPPGEHEVEETFHRNHRWLKLAGEDWGNAEMCWEAVRAVAPSPVAPPKTGLLAQINRLRQAVSKAVKGTPRLHQQAEAQKLFQQASQFIRDGDWSQALPCLQKATKLDRDRYEFAYRWVQAVRHTSSDAATAQAVKQVLQQSQWTESEQQMLLQLQRPSGK